MEYLPYGIEEYMTSCLPDTQDKLINKMFSLLSLLHNHDIVHRDIKPDNFMIKGTSIERIYLIDYGMAKRFDKYEQPRALVGSQMYASVNIHKGLPYGRRDDLESLGYLIAHLFYYLIYIF